MTTRTRICIDCPDRFSCREYSTVRDDICPLAESGIEEWADSRAAQVFAERCREAYESTGRPYIDRGDPL